MLLTNHTLLVVCSTCGTWLTMRLILRLPPLKVNATKALHSILQEKFRKISPPTCCNAGLFFCFG